MTGTQVVVALFDTATFATLTRLPTGAPALHQLTWLSDGRTLLAATSDGRLLKWQHITPPPSPPLSQQRLLTAAGLASSNLGTDRCPIAEHDSNCKTDCAAEFGEQQQRRQQFGAHDSSSRHDISDKGITLSSRRMGCRCFVVDEQREYIAAGGADGMLRLWPLHWQVGLSSDYSSP